MTLPSDPLPDEDPRDGYEFYLARARESLALAEAETLLARKRVHARAAEQWLHLAAVAKRVEARATVMARRHVSTTIGYSQNDGVIALR